jgi:hypothetical protein
MSDSEHTPYEPEQGSIPLPEQVLAPTAQTADDSLGLFHSWPQTEIARPKRIPHFGHLCLLTLLALAGSICGAALVMAGMHFHIYGVTTMDQAKSNVCYTLGSTAALYLVAFLPSLAFFPLFWKKSFFAGVHWRGATALRLGWKLPAISVGCFTLALLNQALLPGPKHAPIEDIFRSPGAAWLMFGFGVVFAPFFEEMAFRGFMLPALATAWDWAIEKSTGKPARPLDENGHPQWSIFAMVIASIPASILFALMHTEQQGRSLSLFLLFITISMILCAVRIVTRSLAASTVVHACYNFMLFFLMLVSTGGFRHLDKL